MGSSRRSPPADPAGTPDAGGRRRTTKGAAATGEALLLDAVSDALREAVEQHAAAADRAATPMHARVVVALSGGRDSIALLDALARLAARFRIALSAMHVHHGLSINADTWAKFCADECAKRDVPLVVHRARIERRGGTSLEAAARAARYAALATADADFI